MPTVTNTIPHLTLMRLWGMYPSLFYKQDWYRAEEFAHVPLELGVHRFYVDLNAHAPSAVACAYYFIEHLWKEGNQAIWGKQYVWTSSYDGNGHRVYVGGWQMGPTPGFQIHRHLTNPSVSEIGYAFGG